MNWTLAAAAAAHFKHEWRHLKAHKQDRRAPKRDHFLFQGDDLDDSFFFLSLEKAKTFKHDFQAPFPAAAAAAAWGKLAVRGKKGR